MWSSRPHHCFTYRKVFHAVNFLGIIIVLVLFLDIIIMLAYISLSVSVISVPALFSPLSPCFGGKRDHEAHKSGA